MKNAIEQLKRVWESHMQFAVVAKSVGDKAAEKKYRDLAIEFKAAIKKLKIK
jgi:hypothetical protein